MPACARSWMWSQKSRRAPGSTPAVGSSSSSSLGSCRRHAASASRCFQPPERLPASCELRAASPRRSSASRHAPLAVGHGVHARDEIEVLRDREVLVEAEALRHVAHLALDALGVAHDVVAEAGAAALVGREQPAEHADRGGLAAAVRAEEAVDLPARAPAWRSGPPPIFAPKRLVSPRTSIASSGAALVDGAFTSASRPRAGPDAGAAPSAAAGRASTRNTIFARQSLL